MGEFLATLFICYILYIVFFAPVNTNSTSYRLGRGVGNKTRKFGEWLTRDDWVYSIWNIYSSTGDSMRQVTDSNRDMIIEEYAGAILDSMDAGRIWDFAFECLVNKKDLLTNDVLQDEIEDFCPEILEGIVW